jgi:NAD(P)H-hydrate epimerase
VRVLLVDAVDAPAVLPASDLVIDAAYGTGFRGSYVAPDPAGAPVLAVDVPSGIDGLTGEAGGQPVQAKRTVTFAALKPGLLLGDGDRLAGEVEVADIGLDVSSASAHLVEDADVARWVPARPVDAHKWRAAAWVVAGSPGMTGAAHLCARAAQRGGAGYVRLSTPGVDDDPQRPTEAVGHPLASGGWDRAVLADLGRFAALVIGPGLGRSESSATATLHVVSDAPVSVVVDGDGLTALGADARAALHGRERPAVLTPHDGEFEHLAGHRPGADRLAEARALADDLGAVVLLKGPTTVVAAPDGDVLVVRSGDQRLATAGTGDVLSGLVGAFCAQGVDPFHAAAAAAHVHGRAATLGWPTGLVAGDLPDLVPPALASIRSPE